MTQQPTNWDEEWTGLEPEPPRAGQNWMLLGIVLTTLLLLAVCLGGMYLVVGQLSERTGPNQLLPPGADQNGAVEDEEETAVSPADDPPVAATVTLPGAPPPADQTGSSQAIAVRLSSPPTINGNLSDWPDAPTTQSSHVVHRADGVTRSPTALATWRLGWDDTHLYVITAVTDDIHVQTQQGSQVFRGDSLELQIETNPNRNASSLGPSNFQIALSPGNFSDIPPSAFRFQGNAQGQMRDALGHSIVVAANQTDEGYIVEAAIPWADLNMTATAGLTLRVALNLNDNDTPGTARQEMMLSNVSTRQYANPLSWGTLRLQE